MYLHLRNGVFYKMIIMKIVMNKLIIVSLLFLITSCRDVIYEDVSFSAVYKIAKDKNKKLWVMLGGGDRCISCNDMIDKLKNKGVFKKYSKDYIFYKCNVIDTSNIFLHYIFLTEEIPNSYIFDEKGELVFASYKRETVNRIEESLKLCNSEGKYHCNQDQLQNLSSDDLLRIHNYTFRAYMNYQKGEEALPYIDSSINICPYFYNTYLKSKILNGTGNKQKAEEFEKISMLYYKPGFQALLYKDIYEPLKIKYNVIDIKNNNTAKIKFDDEIMNLGEISAKTEYKFSFNFQNIGTKPLVLYAVKTDCGCISTKFSKNPILPNERSFIEVIFNEKVKGPFNREIRVLSNSQESYIKLNLRGKIKFIN